MNLDALDRKLQLQTDDKKKCNRKVQFWQLLWKFAESQLFRQKREKFCKNLCYKTYLFGINFFTAIQIKSKINFLILLKCFFVLHIFLFIIKRWLDSEFGTSFFCWLSSLKNWFFFKTAEEKFVQDDEFERRNQWIKWIKDSSCRGRKFGLGFGQGLKDVVNFILLILFLRDNVKVGNPYGRQSQFKFKSSRKTIQIRT